MTRQTCTHVSSPLTSAWHAPCCLRSHGLSPLLLLPLPSVNNVCRALATERPALGLLSRREQQLGPAGPLWPIRAVEMTALLKDGPSLPGPCPPKPVWTEQVGVVTTGFGPHLTMWFRAAACPGAHGGACSQRTWGLGSRLQQPESVKPLLSALRLLPPWGEGGVEPTWKPHTWVPGQFCQGQYLLTLASSSNSIPQMSSMLPHLQTLSHSFTFHHHWVSPSPRA